MNYQKNKNWGDFVKINNIVLIKNRLISERIVVKNLNGKLNNEPKA